MMATPEAQKCVDLFMLKLAAAHGNAPVPDEPCEHVQLGVEMAGGVVFSEETPIKSVGMCQPCLDWCNANFDDPQPLSRPILAAQPQQAERGEGK